MLNRPRTWLAAPGALLLVLALTGGALGANVLTTGPAPEEVTDPLVVDTTASWEDLDGNGVDDDCQEIVEADAEAALAAFDAADSDGDGTLSVEEVAHTDWAGGANCNHGGVVSFVAHLQSEDDEETTEDEAEEAAAAAEACEATEVEPFDPTVGSFGEYVSTIAGSDAVGGTNCNHGGAVSEAAHAAKELAREARDAAKAERAEERAAAKAEREAARSAARAERDAARAVAKEAREAARTEKSNKGKHGGG
jgi:hypothetical protein